MCDTSLLFLRSLLSAILAALPYSFNLPSFISQPLYLHQHGQYLPLFGRPNEGLDWQLRYVIKSEHESRRRGGEYETKVEDAHHVGF